MNKLLIEYIKKYISESTIPYSGEEIDAKLQHKISPNISKDMTSIFYTTEDVLKILMQNIDEKTCISFVNKYDENIPTFNVNPNAIFQTPHGNYAYSLTLENLKELISKGTIDGSSFAIERPYFLLFKIKSPNTLIIDKYGKSNYKELRSARRATSKSEVITLEKDIDTIIRTFIYYTRTSRVEPEGAKKWTSSSTRKFNTLFYNYWDDIYDHFEDMLNYDITVEGFYKKVGTELSNLVISTEMSLRTDIPKVIEEKYYKELFDLFKERLLQAAESDLNKFYKHGEQLDDFHKVYFICWLLSYVGKIANNKHSNGPILTLLLKSIGLDAIIDQGSSTLHFSEPSQTVSLNFGNIEAKDIEFLGTFNNIFNHPHYRKKLDDIAAKIYKEEGFKYDIDFYAKKESREKDNHNPVFKEVKKYLKLLHSKNYIWSTLHTMDDDNAIFNFSVYLDNIEKNTQMYDKIFKRLEEFRFEYFTKMSGENAMLFNVSFSQEDYLSFIDVNKSLNKILSSKSFNSFFTSMSTDISGSYKKYGSFLNTKIQDVGRGQLVFTDSIFFEKYKMGVYGSKIEIINCGNKFEIIINEKSKIDELLKFDYIIIDDSPIIINIKSIDINEKEKQEYSNQIKAKFSKVKVSI